MKAQLSVVETQVSCIAAALPPATQEQVRVAYTHLIDGLDNLGVMSRVLGPGMQMPAFHLPNAEGQMLSSGELLESGPLVLTFFRDGWCPSCSAMLASLEAALPEIRAAGATLLALTPVRCSLEGREWGHGRHYEVLLDQGNNIALQFGVVVDPPESYYLLLAELGFTSETVRGDIGSFVPLPAVFIVDGSGVVRNAWVDNDVTRHADPALVVDALRRLALSSGHPLMRCEQTQPIRVQP